MTTTPSPLTLPAGPALNAQIARELFALSPVRVEEAATVFTLDREFLDVGEYYTEDADGRRRVARYSAEMGAAWLVVERLREQGWLVVLKAMPNEGEFLAGNDWTRDPKVQEKYVCEVARLAYVDDHEQHPAGQRAFWAFAATPAHAICLAALKVVRAKQCD